MLRTKFKKPADRAKNIWIMKFPTSSISLLLSSYELKCPYQNTKPQLFYCPDGLLVKLRVCQTERPGLNRAFLLFFLNFYSLQTDAKKVCLQFFLLFLMLSWSKVKWMTLCQAPV